MKEPKIKRSRDAVFIMFLQAAYFMFPVLWTFICLLYIVNIVVWMNAELVKVW